MGTITRFDDAKALRAMGLPLNQPVVDFDLSAQAEKKIIAVHKAARAFGKAVVPWVKKQTGKRYAKGFQTWNDLAKALSRADKWIEGNSGGPQAPAVAAFIEPCRVVCDQWDELLSALEDGEEFTFRVDEAGARTLNGGVAPWPLGPFPDAVLIHSVTNNEH